MALEWNSTSSTTGLLPRVLGSEPANPLSISVVLLTSSSFVFCERKNVLKEIKKEVGPDFYL